MSLIGFGTNIGKGLLHQVAEGFRYAKELTKGYLGPSVHSVVTSIRENFNKIFFMKGSDEGKPSQFERNVIAPVAGHVFRGASKAHKALTWLQESRWHEKAKKKPSDDAHKAHGEGHEGGAHHHPSDTIHHWGHFFEESAKAAMRAQIPEPEPGSDEWLIREEQKLINTYGSILNSEGHSTPLPNTPADQNFIPGLIHEINRRREKEGLSSLKMDSQLMTKANAMASTAAADRYLKIPEDLLSYRLHPFLTRREEKADGEHGEHAAHGDHQTAHGQKKVFETDQAYAHRIREAGDKRKNDHHEKYDELMITFDLIHGDIFDGDPKKIIDKITEHPLYQEKLLGGHARNKQAIGLALQKKGTRMIITMFLTKDPQAESPDAGEQAAPMKEYSDEAWFHLIPETERKKPTEENKEMASIYELYHSIPSPDAPFRSGYTLYHYYLLKQEIDRLSENGLDIGITRVQATRKNKIFGKDLDGIEITVLINNREEKMVTLLKGTDIIVFKEKYLIDKTTQEEGQRQSFQSKAEFSEELGRMAMPITGLINMIEEKYPGGRERTKKRSGKERPSTGEEAREAAREAASVEEDELQQLGM